jgi:3'-phosphoadenosine 5'-phosphosulfate sulfotransferase (PAPS reductase)/FAD synthetase
MLVAYSGSMISATLLHLAADLPNRSFIDKPIVGHVDTSAAFGLSAEARDEFLSSVRAKCQGYNLQCEIIAIEDVLLDPAEQDPATTATARRERVRDILSGSGTLTAKEDLYSNMIRAALLILAKRLKFVFFVFLVACTELFC